MIANYGYKDGSGEYYIILDTDKCNGCGDCIKVCPYGVLVMVANDYDIEGGDIPAVTDEHRKKIKYSCSPCKPTTGERKLPCVLACKSNALTHSW